MSIKIEIQNEGEPTEFNLITFSGHISRSNWFLHSKVLDRKEENANWVKIYSCYFGARDSNVDTVFDIPDTTSLSVRDSFLYGCITDSSFSPERMYIDNSHISGSKHFFVSSTKNIFILESHFNNTLLALPQNASVSISSSMFNDCLVCDSGANIDEEKLVNRYVSRSVFNVCVESRAFVNVDFYDCSFPAIFARVNRGTKYAMPFKGCVFNDCNFGNLNPSGHFDKLFYRCKFVNCLFKEKEEYAFLECEFENC